MKLEITFEIEKDEDLIVLTIEEARDLYNKLKQHFGDDPPVTIYPPAPPPVMPWPAPNTGTPYPNPPWTITCSYSNTVTN